MDKKDLAKRKKKKHTNKRYLYLNYIGRCQTILTSCIAETIHVTHALYPVYFLPCCYPVSLYIYHIPVVWSEHCVVAVWFEYCVLTVWFEH